MMTSHNDSMLSISPTTDETRVTNASTPSIFISTHELLPPKPKKRPFSRRTITRIFMPTKRGFCGCFGPRTPPEISLSVEDQLKPVEVELPMPDNEEEIDSKFSLLVDELGLDRAHREAMFSLSPEKKWQIYCSKKKEQQDPRSARFPDHYVDSLKKMVRVVVAHNEEEVQHRVKLLDSLKTALRTQPMSFVMRFLELDGLNSLLSFIKSMDKQTKQSAIHTSVIGCIKALMNSVEGRTHVLSHPECIQVIAQSLHTNNSKTKVAVLEILGAVCLVPGGHQKVLQAMVHYQHYRHERTRFQTLMQDLDEEPDDKSDDVSLQTAIMGFINAALRYGPGQKHLEFRLHLRYEFLMLGIQQIVDKLRKHDNQTLNTHLDFFEMMRSEDEKLLGKKFESNHIDTRSASAMFELLKKKLCYSVMYPKFISLLFHLIQMPFGTGDSTIHLWGLVDRVVQQIVIQTKAGDPDHSPLDIDVKKVVKQLAKEEALNDIQQKIDDVKAENESLKSELEKKDRECLVINEERNELLNTLDRIRAKLDKELEGHMNTKSQLAELQYKVEHLRTGKSNGLTEGAIVYSSLSDDMKSATIQSDVHLTGSGVPVPPLCFAPPPPPPPPAPGLQGFPGLAQRVKDTPKPGQAMKSFNWSKVPENQLNGTIWMEIEEMRVYKELNLVEFEQTFSAYQHKDSEDLLNKSVTKAAKELSVIDGRRAQNCTILLSKLKLTNEELARAVLSVDAREEIHKDMCEQLLKFIATPEEIQLLSEHEHEIDQMAKADRFLFEMSKVSHYENRLKALYYKKKFNDRLHDAKPKVEAVLEACKQVHTSRRFRNLLRLVLALGNYMNRGQRGNASGFKLASINKMIDTKSSNNKKITLLHYLAQLIERQFTDLLKFEKDLTHVQQASKVNLTELDRDISSLRVGLKDIEQELKHQRQIGYLAPPGDKFVNVMSGFISVATYNFQELEEQYNEMKEKFVQVTKYFCEESTCQPDEFFAMFDMFMATFNEAILENAKFIRDREQEKQRLEKELQLKTEKEKRGNRLIIGKSKSVSGMVTQENKGEFDDLISALRTGDVFGEDIAKLKRVRKRGSNVATKADITRERSGLTNGTSVC